MNLEEKILNEWIPDLQRKFQDFMPPIDKEYPRIYFTNGEDTAEVMTKIDEDINTLSPVVLSYAFAEYMHGETADAILIHTEFFNGEPEENYFTRFAVDFWTQLGYFYLISIEHQEWFDNYNMYEDEWDAYCEENEEDPDFENHFSAKYGYQVWNPFAAAAIAQILRQKYFAFDTEYFKQIQSYQQYVFNRDYINECDIGTYFAMFLTNAIKDEALSMPDNVRHFIDKLREVFEPQFRKNPFWITDEKTLQEIGNTYMDLDLQFTINRWKKEDRNRYHHQHIEPIAPSPDEMKKRQKAKRKAQKQARKNNRRKK